MNQAAKVFFVVATTVSVFIVGSFFLPEKISVELRFKTIPPMPQLIEAQNFKWSQSIHHPVISIDSVTLKPEKNIIIVEATLSEPKIHSAEILLESLLAKAIRAGYPRVEKEQIYDDLNHIFYEYGSLESESCSVIEEICEADDNGRLCPNLRSLDVCKSIDASKAATLLEKVDNAIAEYMAATWASSVDLIIVENSMHIEPERDARIIFGFTCFLLSLLAILLIFFRKKSRVLAGRITESP